MFISFVRIHFPFSFAPLPNVSYSYLSPLIFFVTECFLSPVIITSGCKAGPALCSCSEIFLRLPSLQIPAFLFCHRTLCLIREVPLNDNRVFQALFFFSLSANAFPFTVLVLLPLFFR